MRFTSPTLLAASLLTTRIRPPLAQIEPLQQSLSTIITASLDRHAQRGQRVGTAAEPTVLRLSTCSLHGWCRVVDALAPFMKERRVRRLEAALHQRRKGLELVVENIADPWNLASLMRSAEALGVQHVHLIESVTLTMLPAGTAHATARGSLGRTDSNGDSASRWLTVHRYKSTEALVAALRARRMLIYSSDCPAEEEEGEAALAHPAAAAEGMGWVTAKAGEYEAAVAIEDVDFGLGSRDGHEGIALVFGNERRGVSRLLLEASDGLFFLPMAGFTQSFNIGVALAMSLNAAIRSGAFPVGGLPESERIEIMGRWLLRDVKGARTHLHHAGVEFDDF